MNKVYTKTGDAGTTSLVGGKRVPKACARLESYGTIDELNAQVGLLLTYVTESIDRDCLISVQNNLFVIGAQLATEPDLPHQPSCVVTLDDVSNLEQSIDRASEDLPKWRGFTLPGGCRAAALAHVCRTVCRRAERRILALNASEPVDTQLLAYVNRLSDYFYVLALRLNFLQGTEEILWKK
ncbi:MAG: cob(I)yrinic acid a,c-diamide adenosyltransferase [Bacteroidaceae bacterium]|nr:cob(I)yrinic acid a,c-diamide adenosyltransferase [Bacteroidaceae bacterium]